MNKKKFTQTILVVFVVLFSFTGTTLAGNFLNLDSLQAFPGKTITIPVILERGGKDNKLSAISTDISFDSSLFENPQVKIGEAAGAAGKNIITNRLSQGKIRIAIISMTNNIPIKDGVIVLLQLKIKANAKAGIAILSQVASASSPEGVKIEIQGKSGRITINNQ